ncbi:MAG: elongation factor 1-beta [Aigarchaeota archaeon]|nr:elongation factor 1-beta [Aigarchaeota archaeon]MCX8192647.1 elongation factor 1-beta [Nitrososphaeria archaeon]MDW7985607.1 elongation factor 1-beta [Nitrososphaerota archaeon]
MGKVIVVVRIMPIDETVDVDNLISRIKTNLPEKIELASVKVEPFVYGVNIINALFAMPDEEGYPAKLEEYLKEFKEVGEIDISRISRI